MLETSRNLKSILEVLKIFKVQLKIFTSFQKFSEYFRNSVIYSRNSQTHFRTFYIQLGSYKCIKNIYSSFYKISDHSRKLYLYSKNSQRLQEHSKGFQNILDILFRYWKDKLLHTEIKTLLKQKKYFIFRLSDVQFMYIKWVFFTTTQMSLFSIHSAFYQIFATCALGKWFRTACAQAFFILA